MTEPFARLEVQRYRPKRERRHHDRPVVEMLYLRLRSRDPNDRRTLASLTPVPLVATGDADDDGFRALPADRARAWEELGQWICHLVIYPDEVVKAGQDRNRILWQSWAHDGADRPTSDDLYDWRRDETALDRLRASYASVAARLGDVVGWPSRADIAARHPNPFEDEGLSDDARRLVRDLKAIFGTESVRDA